MIAFGFIENFFFISLALVFVLVFLLLYHFKNRITVAEKKSDCMYTLLTAAVKEVKKLRGMFGLAEDAKLQAEPTLKPASEVGGVVPSTIILPPPPSSTNFASFVEKKNAVVEENVSYEIAEPKEVIVLELAASDNKIVVSDIESEDEYSSDSDDDDESTTPNEGEVDEVIELDANESNTDLMLNEEPTEINLESVDLSQEVEVLENNRPQAQEVEVDISNMIATSNPEEIEVNLVETKPVATEVSSVFSQVPSNEQLRKMNINQLKTIASQLGISTDLSKMKKPELISLIRGGNDAM